MVVTIKLDDSENEFVGLIERVEDFIPSDGDRRRTRHPSLYLYEAKPPGAGNPTFDVIAEFLELPISRFETKTTLDFHHDLARSCGGSLSVRGFRET